MNEYSITFSQNQLLERLRLGDAAAFTEIYDGLAEKLVTYCYNILQDRETCRDLVHDIFLGIWQRRETLNVTTSLESYLFIAARNQVFQVMRKGRVRESVFNEIELKIWGAPTPDNLLYQKELQARLMHIVSDLPEKMQEVYRLSREQHLSHKEISEQLSISTKTVENHLTAALKKIRLSLQDLLPLIILLLGRK